MAKLSSSFAFHADKQSQNQAIALQPFDARVRKEAYIKLNYPFILGATCAGTIAAIGQYVPSTFAIGDRVVSDTPVYKKRETRYGGWQKYVVGRAGLTAKVRGWVALRGLI
jgi:NADPH:quinone reductase-like Zn-dependent oxidoreductase